MPENQIFDRFTECEELDPGKLWQSDVGLVDEPWRVRSWKVGVVSETDISEVQGIRSLTDILSARNGSWGFFLGIRLLWQSDVWLG